MLWFRCVKKKLKKKNRFRLQSKRKLPLKKKLPFILVEKKMDQKIFREFRLEIHRTEKDGVLCIYPQFLENISHKNAHKKRKEKFSKNFKLSIHNVASTGTNVEKSMAFYVAIGCIRFARYCGKMYSRHLFPYGGLRTTF